MTTNSDIQINFPVPRLPGDECELDSETHPCHPAQAQSQAHPQAVLLPPFTAEQIDEALLQIWTVKPQVGYLRNLILSHDHLHIADLSIWRTPKGVYLRNLIFKHKGKFMKSLIGAFTREDTTAASQTMIKDLDNWILELRTHAMTALGKRLGRLLR